MADKIIKEKEFHNQRFTEEVRISTQKFYKIERASREKFKTLMRKNIKNKKVLELGCGKGSYAIQLAELGGNLIGIDISEVAIDYSQKQAEEKQVKNNTNFLVMNAEKLDFPSNYFDRVIGSSILHHLDLDKAISEIARVLKSDGDAIFIEPLGHNFFINLYRKLTPKLRTEDEHPLKLKDLSILNNYFNDVEIYFYHLFTLFAVPFRKMSFFNNLLSFLEKLDQTTFKFLPFLKKQAWQIVIKAKNKSESK